MSQRTQCDRCLVIIERNKRVFNIDIRPSLMTEDVPHSRDYLQLCPECHVQLIAFLSMGVAHEPQRVP